MPLEITVRFRLLENFSISFLYEYRTIINNVNRYKEINDSVNSSRNIHCFGDSKTPVGNNFVISKLQIPKATDIAVPDKPNRSFLCFLPNHKRNFIIMIYPLFTYNDQALQ